MRIFFKMRVFKQLHHLKI